jgi:trimeric autotransporter adhesin
MDQLQTRLDALEQHVQTLQQQTHTVTRRLRWWRGLAGGLIVMGLLGWGLPLGLAREDARDKDKDQKGIAQRVAALEDLLKHFSREDNEVFLTGANLHLVNGLGSTDCTDDAGNPIPGCPNGLGNLIVGYNELRGGIDDIRTGSHNVVVGTEQNFSRFGGIVVGRTNTISGNFASVSGGAFNTASGDFAVVSGGFINTASGFSSSVSGGDSNTASRESSAVSGGFGNTASGGVASISGGLNNTASGDHAVVIGGALNTASVANAVVSGGQENTASGVLSTVSGGDANTASGLLSSVSGGRNRTAAGEFDWVAGELFEDF